MSNTQEKYLLPNGMEILFCPETHQYTVNGIDVPSVTQVISKMYNTGYDNVRPDVLANAAEYGTKVHEELQYLIEIRKSNAGAPLICEYQETDNYFKFIEPIYNVVPLETEKVIVLFDKNNQPVCAGRFDLLCNIKDELTLADFKTTSVLHKQLIAAQLTVYSVAAQQCGYINDNNIKLAAIHLSGETSRCVPIVKLGQGFIDKFIQKATELCLEVNENK